MSTADLELVIVLTRGGGPGGDWTATLDNNRPEGPVAAGYGPASSPGELLEEVALELDDAEATAITNARKDPTDA